MLQRGQIMRGKRTLTAKMCPSFAIFSVYMPSDHATTSCNATPGPRDSLLNTNINMCHRPSVKMAAFILFFCSYLN